MNYSLKNQIVTLPNSGLKICIADEGHGEVLFFVHGLSANLSCWSEAIHHFKSSYRCVAIDLPGHGLSDKNIKKFSITFFRTIIEEIVELLRLDKFTLIGHSMGGQTAVKYSIFNEEHVEKLVLVAPAGFEKYSAIGRKLLLEVAGRQKRDDLTDDKIKYVWSLNYNDRSHPMIDQDVKLLKQQIKETGEDAYLSMMYGCLEALLNEPVYDDLQLLRMPVQVIFGSGDRLIPNKILHPLLTTKGIASDGASRISDCRLDIIDDGGHFVQREKFNEFNFTLREFLRNN